MFRFVTLLTTILACTQYTSGSNLYGASHHAPTASVISGQYGYGSLANSAYSRNLAIPATSVISSYSSAINHPSYAVSHPIISGSIPHVGNQQYISAPLTHQTYASPLVSRGLYGHGQNGLHSNSYAIQRSYTGPLIGSSGHSAHGLYSSPIVANAYGYGAPLVQGHGGHGHLFGW